MPTMYASGMEIVPQGAPNAGDLVIADTGNNQVAEYTTSGTQVWRVGIGRQRRQREQHPVRAAS